MNIEKMINRKDSVKDTLHTKCQSFEMLLEEAVNFHGHLCAGQVIGVRMSMLGLELLGITDPKGADRKKIYVVVEIDRCAADAIQSVTGCRIGKRTMRWVDYGIMAATYVNLETGRGVRITAREESRHLADKYCPEIVDKYQRQLEAYRIMPNDELFQVQKVSLSIDRNDMPGRPLNRVACSRCGDWVQDGREVAGSEGPICRACDRGAYYTVATD